MRRAGEGPQRGKHLYYRCTDRVRSFPLPAKCLERGINAKIADQMVWDKISTLMLSPKLMSEQIKKWQGAQHVKWQGSAEDTKELERELAKLKDEADRYNTAYGRGVFTIEQLKEYSEPVQKKIASLKDRLAKIESQRISVGTIPLPNTEEVEEFADEAREALSSLNFASKQAIIRHTVEQAIGTPTGLKVRGLISTTKTHKVGYEIEYRHSRSPKRR